MWKVVITEIQDANTLEPIHAPPGAFFVSTERFARTVDCLDLPNIISVINRMQSSPRGCARENLVPSEGFHVGTQTSSGLRETRAATARQ